VLSAGDDAAALDLLVRGGNSSSDELSSRGVAGLVALPGPPPEGDWSPDDANPQVREREREKNGGIIFVFLLHAKRRPPPPKNSQPRAKGSRKTKKTKQQSEYCPYQIPANFSWVRGARGLLRAPLPVPILAPYGDFAAVVAEAAGAKVDPKDKERKTPPPPLRLAALDDAMEASRSGARNSSHCLAQGTCGPIGGYSVWAALPAMPPPPSPEQEGPAAAGRAPTSPPPPVGDGLGPPPPPPPPVPPPPPAPPPPAPAPTPPPNSSATARTVVLAAAADSRQLLHGGSAGAGALSGLVALLAAAEALGNATRFSLAAAAARAEGGGSAASPPAPFPGRILFVALAAEPWGFLGSRRLLWEARSRSDGDGDGDGDGGGGGGGGESGGGGGDDAAGGFPLGDVSWLIELGAVGDAPSPPTNGSGEPSPPPLLFAHPGTTAGSREGPAAALLLNSSSPSAPSRVVLAAPAAAGGPGGPPPGSLWAWAAAAPDVASALLSAHEGSLGGPHASSRWDDARRLDPRAVAAAAAVAARAAAAGAGAPAEFLALSPSNAPSSSSSSASSAPPFLSAEAVLPRVLDLISCLVAREAGLAGGGGASGGGARGGGRGRGGGPCRLTLELLGERGAAEAHAAALAGSGTPHHAGPLPTLSADPQAFDPLTKTPYARLLWEFLAGATREGGEEEPPCERGGGGSCPAGTVCARSSSTSSSSSDPPSLSCVRASVAFVAAYPLNIECSGCDGAENYGNWHALPETQSDGGNQTRPPPAPPLPAAAAADAWRRSLGWPREPLWAESSWEGGVPSLSLWRTSASPSGGPGPGPALLWAAAAAASAGVALGAAAARRELEREGGGLGGEEAEEGDDQGFVPSF